MAAARAGVGGPPGPLFISIGTARPPEATR